jgi:predicted small metal-binding protein
MAKAVSCNCGWHAHGTEEELVSAFSQHLEQMHGARISREQAAAKIVEEQE